ncbi:MAG: SusC/RagA family TonB-linked outer membrane protein [Ginsengibacter sp.]
MKRKKLLMLFLFCWCMGMSYGQTKVRGTIVDDNNNPVVGASITIKNLSTSKGTLSDQQGNFTISVPAGYDLLVVSYVGMKTQEVRVKPNVTVVMNATNQTLGEVKITAEFGIKRLARSVGSDAQTVSGKNIAESGFDNLSTALQGKVSGLNVTSSGGAPGSSTTIVLRNLTSISGNNQPLYVVDGVPMNNSSFDPILTGGDDFSVRNEDFSSRGNDFNPEDIASITVLKGAAAAALYGSDASNGAIIITTKKGHTGKARVTYNNQFAWDKAYGIPEEQTKYANGAYGTTNYYYTSRYGGLYPAGMKLYDNVAAVLQTGVMSRHNISVEGGTEKASIRASASTMDQTGVIKTTDYGRTNFGLAGKVKVDDWFNVETSMQYVHTNNRKALRGTDGPLYQAMLWPIVDDMSNYLADDGLHMRNPDYYVDVDLLNPLFALNKNKYYDVSDRFISQLAATLNPFKHTFIRGQVGWDVGLQTFESSKHPYFAYNNAGTGVYYLTHANFSDPTINILAGYDNKFFNDKFTFSAQVGYHQLENRNSDLTTNGSNFTVADFQSINNVDPATIVSSQRNTRRRIQAISGQFEFGYKNMAFLTLRGRNDWSSTLPVQNNSYFYPAVEGSFILSDLKPISKSKFIDYLKIRGAVAQVGKDAGPLQIEPQLESTGMTGGGFKYGFTGPNRNLKPEMTTSREVGLEGRVLNNRINFDFTYYKTHEADQIVQNFRLSYATGFILNTLNVGTFNTWGWEGHVDADILRTAGGVRWNVGINASQGNSKVVYLPPSVSEYYNPYTWNSGNIRNGIMVGYPITTVTGLAYQRNDAGQVLISPTTGLPLTSSTWSVIGDREPKVRFGITTSLNYSNFSLSAVFAGRYHATVVNGTKRVMLTRGTSIESVGMREGPSVIFNGVLKDGSENSKSPTPNNIEVDYSTGIFGGGDEDWLEKNVNYLRMQEVRLGYRLPEGLLRKTGVISAASVFVSGNDLITITNYSGIDAVGNTVTAAAGGTGGEGYDVWSLPSPRRFSAGISITFN